MDERAVVTCFLRHDGRVLLFRRSDAAGSYPGRWGTVTGYLTPERDSEPEPPGTAARREIREETGLGDAVTLIRTGDRLRVVDGDTAWLVHPFLFEASSRAVEPNEETADCEWAHPTEILRRETVPDLWGSYDRVRPTVDSVRTDAEHGAAWLSRRALEVLRDEAALVTEGEGDARTSEAAGLRETARELLAARPSMTVVANRINRVVRSAVETADTGERLPPRAVETAACQGIESAVVADEEAAAVAARRIDADRICTLSRSGTVRAAVERVDPEAVLVATSRPGGEGVAVAEDLATAYDVTLTSDAALASQIDAWGADAVLVGADTILPDGRVLNKVGTRAAALAAAHEEVPCYAVASVDKVAPEGDVTVEKAHDPIYDGDAPLSVANPLFDVAPAECLRGVCTEKGLLGASELAVVAARHLQRREW